MKVKTNSDSTSTLLGLLVKYMKSRERAKVMLEQTSLSLGLEPKTKPLLIALTLCKLGLPAEEVSRFLTWREFEQFCSDIISAHGYNVTESLTIRRPRMQIDIVAESDTLIIAADCKHWKANYSYTVMKTFALRQLARCQALRDRFTYPIDKPIVPVIITLRKYEKKFVDGVPVVPLFALRNFILSLEGILHYIHTV